jgi:large subunit ribosomal protein L9
LLPRSLAMAANPGSMSQAQAMRTARDIKDAKNRDSSETIARTLVPAVIKIVAKAKEGRLFGSVAEKDIVEAVKTQTGVVLERRTLHMSEHIKTTGTHSVTVRLHSDVQFAVTVEVTSA